MSNAIYPRNAKLNYFRKERNRALFLCANNSIKIHKKNSAELIFTLEHLWKPSGINVYLPFCFIGAISCYVGLIKIFSKFKEVST